MKSSTKIAHQTGGGPTLSNADFFGHSVASVGDLNGDGITDLAVGVNGDDTGGPRRGAVYVLLLNADGTVNASTKIAHNMSGGPSLANEDYFGHSVAGIGDLDGDGINDLAVGANRDDTDGADRGAVHLLLLNANGTVKDSTKIASGTVGGSSLTDGGRFGGAVTSLGDIDGDGVIDLAVGAYLDSTGGIGRGAVHVLFLETLDETAPTVTVDLDDSALKAGDAATVTFTFSEAPVGFTAGDVTVQN